MRVEKKLFCALQFRYDSMFRAYTILLFRCFFLSNYLLFLILHTFLFRRPWRQNWTITKHHAREPGGEAALGLYCNATMVRKVVPSLGSQPSSQSGLCDITI